MLNYESVHVWKLPPPELLPDKMNTTCDEAVPKHNATMSRVNETTRKIMNVQAVQEVRELQEMDHSITAYSTRTCNLDPLHSLSTDGSPLLGMQFLIFCRFLYIYS